MPPKSKLSLGRIFVVAAVIVGGIAIAQLIQERKVLAKIIERLKADTRVAEVLVTGVQFNEEMQKNFTTIKFLEFDTDGKELVPKYFTFPGNVIQFQSLVVRFDDKFVMAGDGLRGRSAYLFWKVFTLDGPNTREFPINYMSEVPAGYKVAGIDRKVEEKFWRHFWQYAFDEKAAQRAGVKNVQIEAPGAVFVPGYVYIIKIEHDGGLRIDTQKLPPIIRGEKIL